MRFVIGMSTILSNPLTRIYKRASLVPAATVIPALEVYIIVVAVKKVIVGSIQYNPIHPIFLKVQSNPIDPIFFAV